MIKKSFNSISLTISVLVLACSVSAQTTITLKPGAVTGKDAKVWDLNAGTNYGNDEDFIAAAWTWGPPGKLRSMTQFDLTSIPVNASIISAQLSLYYNPTSTSAGQAGINAAWLRRITSSWNESTVTWNTQPTSTLVNEVVLSQSISINQDYPNIDVTALVQDMVNDPANSFGFMFQLQNETPHASMKFCSSDYPDSSLAPKLVITYTDSHPSTDSCIVMQPSGSAGTDAMVWTINPGTNYGVWDDFIAAAWTWGGTSGILRSILNFDLSSIPANATVTNAKLSLYYNPTSSSNGQEGANAAYLQRVISAWNENTVTWNTQPVADTTHEVLLPQSNFSTQDYPNIEVTQLVQDMINYPLNSFGFLLRLKDEVNFAALKFATSDYTDESLYPKLEVCFSKNVSVVQPDLEEASVFIFPNPASDLIHVKINLNQSSEVKISLLNITGTSEKTLLDKKENSGTKNFQFDLSQLQLNQGVYILQIKTDRQSCFRKLEIF